ncbi:MAG: pesticidal protein Cry7Aa [Candidatus Doudnabacteria bacterium]|jgi:predicted GH43/DUF377 family glycosyl hydrolase
MLKPKFYGKLLEKTELDFENEGVLNPTCIQKDGLTHMFYRAVKKQNFSSLGYCQIEKDKVLFRAKAPIMVPEYDYEKHGIEDPRIVKIDETYYLFYTAYDGKDARTALACSRDLVKFEKQGLVTPSISYEKARQLFSHPSLPERYNWYALHYQKTIAPDVLLWEKDLILFPKKFNHKLLLLHRVMPGLQYMYLDNLDQLKSQEFWEDQLKELHKHVVMNPKFWYETRKIGASCAPIETPFGWIQIYHGVEETPTGNVYRASVALLDLNDPTKVIGRLAEPLFSPQKEWEKSGIADNVIFPSAACVYGEELYIYYGAADTRIAVASVNLSELIQELINNPNG